MELELQDKMVAVSEPLLIKKMDPEEQSTSNTTMDSQTTILHYPRYTKIIKRRRPCIVGTGSVFLVVVLALVFVSHSVHQVEEGHVGVFYRGGALLKSVAGPGYGVMFPFLTHCVQIPVTNQTFLLRDVSCGTANGVRGHFDRIEVVFSINKSSVYEVVKQFSTNYTHSLILGPLRHEIREFCARHSLEQIYMDKFRGMSAEMADILGSSLPKGVTVHAIRIPKPRIPEEIAAQYEKAEAHKAEVRVAKERLKVEEELAEAEKSRALIEFQKQIELKQEGDKLTVSRVQHVINVIAHVAHVIWKIFIGARLPAL